MYWKFVFKITRALLISYFILKSSRVKSSQHVTMFRYAWRKKKEPKAPKEQEVSTVPDNSLQHTKQVFSDKSSGKSLNVDVTSRKINMNFRAMCNSSSSSSKSSSSKSSSSKSSSSGESYDSSSSSDQLSGAREKSTKKVSKPLDNNKNTYYYCRPNRDIKRALKNQRRQSI